MSLSSLKSSKQVWKHLADNCVSQYTCPVLIDNGNRILFIGKYNDIHGIVMYDVKSDTYPESLMYEHPENTKLEIPGMAFNSNQNVIYIWGGRNHPCFMILDLHTGQWDTKVVQNSTEKIQEKYNVRHVSAQSQTICDSYQILHVIGGRINNEHMFFNDQKQVFEKLHEFEQYSSINEFGLVCDSMNNRLILFGGYNGQRCMDNIWFFNLSTNSWTECKEFKMDIPLERFGFVFLEAIQIILVFGGETSDGQYSDAIFMLDFSDKTCTEIISVKCPMKIWYHALLVPCSDLKVDLSQANIHLFSCVGNHQWCISLESVLPAKFHEEYAKNSESMVLFKPKLQLKMQPEMKEEQPKMFVEVEKEKIFEETLVQQKVKVLQFTAQINQLNIAMEEPGGAIVIQDQNSEMEEEKREVLSNTNNTNAIPITPDGFKRMEVLTKEQIFQVYFCQLFRTEIADKYIPSFVENGFNDMEILMEFATMELSESLSILCNDCSMNKIHARLLLRKVSKLEKENREFQEWLESIRMVEYYEPVMVKAGILTFGILYQSIHSEELLFQLFAQQMPMQPKYRMRRDAIFLWQNLPNNNRELDSGPNFMKEQTGKEGYEEGEHTYDVVG